MAANGSWSPTVASPIFAILFALALTVRLAWVAGPEKSVAQTWGMAFLSLVMVFFVGCLPFGLFLLALIYLAHAAVELFCAPRVPAPLALDCSRLGRRMRNYQFLGWGLLSLAAILAIAGIRTVA